MIATIKGQTILTKDGYMIVDAGGIGYKIFTTNSILADSRVGDLASLYIYHHFTESSQSLYGFNLMEEQEFFELLLTISGIGPKVALNVLNTASLEELRIAVIEDNPEILTNISGIGTKTAHRIVLELKNKITISDVRPIGTKSLDVGSHTDAYEALIKLGYNSVEARAALKMISPDIKDPQEKVKLALRNLVGGR